MRTARTIAAMVFLLVSGIAAAAAQSDLQTFAREDLVLALRDGTRHTFVVEVATSRDQKAQGLMFRPSLAPDAGMLFVYKAEGLRTMWMKNTLIPLDMLFIDRRGEIVEIAERSVPLSLATISSDRPAMAVLELNGGTAARLEIRPGDRVIHGAFKTGP